LKEKLGRVTELRAEQAAKMQRQETLEQEGRRLAETASDLAARLDVLREELARAGARAQAGRELVRATEESLTGHLEQRRRQTAETAELERELHGRRESLARDEASQGSVRAELESLRERTRETELDRARAEAARAHLDDLCRQELGVSAGEATSLARESGEAAAQEDLERLEERIAEIKQRIEELGPVNMTAIEEFSELEERHAFLSSQREDLDRSMDKLQETIRRIDRESRQRFVDAFEQIRLSYQEVFRLLFTGGRADLRLEEGEDVLECGIEILAQPPGKRLTGVHLLSGGEKALSAIALLFAIFRYQPSPFCLLDEVDAALDDANVGRFTRMIGEFATHTQFVIVTHNKLSMESANLIYGVTMEEPGVSKIMSLQLT
jgi:chromosome segregation protein